MSQRMEKVNSQIQKTVSRVISEELRDSEITGLVTVTKVDTAPDFSLAKVYVSMLGSKDNKAVLRGLKKASGYIRTRLAKSSQFRKTPELVFVFDPSVEYGHKINSILKEIMPKNTDETIEEDLENLED